MAFGNYICIPSVESMAMVKPTAAIGPCCATSTATHRLGTSARLFGCLAVATKNLGTSGKLNEFQTIDMGLSNNRASLEMVI